jgi:hypothetical protein
MGTKNRKPMTQRETEQHLIRQLQSLNKWTDKIRRDLATVRGGGKVEIHFTEPERPDEISLKHG